MHWAKQKKILTDGGEMMVNHARAFFNKKEASIMYSIWAETMLECEGYELMTMDRVEEIGGDNLNIKFVDRDSMITYDVTEIIHMKGQLYRVCHDGGFISINKGIHHVYAIPKAGEPTQSPDGD